MGGRYSDSALAFSLSRRRARSTQAFQLSGIGIEMKGYWWGGGYNCGREPVYSVHSVTKAHKFDSGISGLTKDKRMGGGGGGDTTHPILMRSNVLFITKVNQLGPLQVKDQR